MTKRQSALRALVDELGELENELGPYKAKFSRLEAVRAAVRAGFADSSLISADGAKWTVFLGPPKNVSVIDKVALFRAVGWRRFVELAGVTVKSLEGIKSDIQAKVISLKPAGARSLTIVKRADQNAA